jgi:hypothetical protein
MVIGENVLTYKELVSAMTKCHKTVEVPGFPNARLRTDPRTPPATPGSLPLTSYLQELNRLMVTHS